MLDTQPLFVVSSPVSWSVFALCKVWRLPIYEMIDYDGNSWGPRINRAALENAVLKFFPNYGSGDGEHSPQFDAGDQIQSTPGAGIDFYNFLAKSKIAVMSFLPNSLGTSE